MSTPTETAPPDKRCPELHPTAMLANGDRIRCYHGTDHEGRHGNGAITWGDAALATLQAENAELRARVDNATTLHAWETKNLRAEAEARATAAEGERDRLRELLERCCLFIPEKGAIWGDVNAALAATPHTEASERLGAEERKAQAAEGERDRLRELLRDTVSDLDWWYTNHGKQEPTATRASRSLVRRARAALAAIPHAEGEASAPPKETTT